MKIGEKLNPNIQKTVAWLNTNGFQTVDSGDGKTHEYECDRECAYVVMRVDPDRMIEEAERLYSLLEGLNLFSDQDAAVKSQKPLGPEDAQDWVMLEASYSPADKIAILDLVNLDDDRLYAALGFMSGKESKAD